MNNKELLQELSTKLNSGEIGREEILSRLGGASQARANAPGAHAASHFSATKVLYVLGAAIVIIGTALFVGQIWNDIGSVMRVLVTLGLGLLLAAIGTNLLKQKPGNAIGPAFHFIGGMLIPGGAMVLLNEFNAAVFSVWPVTIIFGIVFAFYLALSRMQKHAVLTFFGILNGTVFIYLFVESMVRGSFYWYNDLYAYLTMVIGISYLLLAHSFRGGWNARLISTLHFFGAVAFLGAAFTRVFDSLPWQLLYFLIVIGGLFLSAYMKSRSILAVSTLFLIAHVSYITGEYFADSLGWPISLVILGFIFIGLGYASISINKKYIKGTG